LRGDDMRHLLLDLRGKKAVVFGGGEVGLRKAKYLAAEAEVVVVSKDFVAGFRGSGIRQEMADIAEVLDEWVEWADLVVAATNDSALNGRIAEKSRSLGKYCNRADGPCTFMIPSLVERSNYSVAVSTGGKSPGMSKFLRQELDRMLPPVYERMVSLQEELREEAKSYIADQRDRERFLWSILEDRQIWEVLSLGEEQALAAARQKLVNWNGPNH